MKKIGKFQWPAQGSSNQMTDIAIDRHGVMYGISFDDLYRVNPDTCK